MTYWPVNQPLFTTLLVEEIAAADEEAGPKAKAADTPFRHSDAGKCARAMSYGSLGVERTNPPTAADLWVMYLGTLLHEKMQAAIERAYPGVQLEPKSKVGNTSGHADGLFDSTLIAEWKGERTLFELKTMGGFAFKKAIGMKKWKLEDPEGPRRSAIIQGAINALAHDCETLVVGIVSLENVSKGLADSSGMRDFDRYTAEWHFSREEWEPIALAEIDRQNALAARIAFEGLVGTRQAIDDEGKTANLDPDLKKAPWQCQYCSYLWRCQEDGPDPVPVPAEFRVKESV